MKIVNTFFGKSLGGIERAYINFAQVLPFYHGHDVINLCHPDGAVAKELKNLGLPLKTIRNHGQWDIVGMLRIKAFLRDFQPDIILCHGNRAVTLMSAAGKGICPVVGVAHNYKIRKFKRLDAAISVTDDLRRHLIKEGLNDNCVFTAPNMISPSMIKPFMPINTQNKDSKTTLEKTMVIGALGRFVEKKGFHVFIKSVAQLVHREGMKDFKVILAGDGPERDALQTLVAEHKLEDIISMPGWVKDIESFYDSIDIFCLPSLHEPFGIVALEAMA